MLTIVCGDGVYVRLVLPQHMSKKTSSIVTFGKIIRELRKSQGLTQEDLADKAGVHRTYIGMIERGEKNITLSNIEKLASALNIPISEIFSRVK